MPPAERFVSRFAAEPPQDPLPYGRWAERLSEEFLAACLAVDTDGEQLGEPKEIVWFPDRTWAGRTYVPATVATANGFELFGYVSFAAGKSGDEPSDFASSADFTAETAAANPDWKLDLSDDVVGRWRGERGKQAEMALVWGVPLVPGGAIVTAELADLAVDQCVLMEGRFTLIAPDNYRSDYVEVKLFTSDGRELARESLYEEDE